MAALGGDIGAHQIYRREMRTVLMLMIAAGCAVGCDQRSSEPPPSAKFRDPMSPTERPFYNTTPNAPSRWWCTSAGDQFASCYDELAHCDNQRRSSVELGMKDSPCLAVEAAVCFEATKILDGKSLRRCFDSITLCRNLKGSVLGGFEADYQTIMDCEIVR